MQRSISPGILRLFNGLFAFGFLLFLVMFEMNADEISCRGAR